MTSRSKNIEAHNERNLDMVKDKKVAIVVSEWNSEITEALFKSAHRTLLQYGFPDHKIIKNYVAGSFELPFGAQTMVQQGDVDAAICIGCIIQGETKHFDFIAQATSNGIMEVSLKYNKPVIFGVLTTNNLQQAKDRAGGQYGNKGEEAAITLIKLINSIKNIR